MAYHPEPATDPPEEYYDVAGCEHEIYEGESLWEWDGKFLCPDCMEEVINDLTWEEIAAVYGATRIPIEKPTNIWGCPR